MKQERRVRSRQNFDESNAEGRLISIPEVARRLGIGIGTAYCWASSGKLPSVKLGRLRRVREEDLEQFIRNLPLGATI